MKRKVALLLALIMIVSLVPASVFGTTAGRVHPQWVWNSNGAGLPSALTGTDLTNFIVANRAPQDLQFEIPMSVFAGRTFGPYSPLVIEVQLGPSVNGAEMVTGPGRQFGTNNRSQLINFGWASHSGAQSVPVNFPIAGTALTLNHTQSRPVFTSESALHAQTFHNQVTGTVHNSFLASGAANQHALIAQGLTGAYFVPNMAFQRAVPNDFGWVQTGHVVIPFENVVSLGAAGSGPHVDTGHISVTIPNVLANYAASVLSAWFVESEWLPGSILPSFGVRGEQLLTNSRIYPAAATTGRGFTLHYGDPVHFQLAAPLTRITLRERHVRQGNVNVNDIPGGTGTPAWTATGSTIRNLNHMGAPSTYLGFDAEFDNSFIVRLTAPRGYAWRQGAITGLGAVYNVEQQFTVTSDLGILTVQDFQARVPRPIEHPHEIYVAVRLNNIAEGAVRSAALDALHINGLWLMPLEGAARSGDVNVTVEEMIFSSVATPLRMVPVNHDNHRATFLAAVRQVDPIVLEQTNDDLVELISGNRGYNLDTNAIIWTTPLSLRELIPHAMATNLGNFIDFGVTQPGVQIVNAQFRILNGPAGGSAEWRNWRFYNYDNRDMLPGTRNSPDRLRLHLVQPGLGARDLRTMEVRFQLSIEAGFAGKTGYDEILINGTGVTFGDLGSVPVANVRDPISLDEVETTLLNVGHTFYVTPTSVDNVVIRETEVGDIREGEFIHIYTAWVHSDRPYAPLVADAGGLNVSMSLNPTINAESGMILRQGRTIVTDSRTGATIHQFEVLRGSQGTPAVITISNIQVSGTVHPGRDYYLVVSSNESIAYNDLRETAGFGHTGTGTATVTLGDVNTVIYENPTASGINAGRTWLGAPAVLGNRVGMGTGRWVGPANAQVREHNWRGVFDTVPYGVQIIGWGNWENEAEPGDETETGPRAESLDGVTFTTNVNFRGVANPIVWRRLPGMNHEGGFVSMRAFAMAAGIDEANITWASRVATISGFNYQGQAVIVSVTPDSNRATISVNNVPSEVDIAMMADGLTGPEGTVRPLHEANTIYLPLRFMFNVFGYSEYYNLERQGQSAVISARQS